MNREETKYAVIFIPDEDKKSEFPFILLDTIYDSEEEAIDVAIRELYI